MIGTRAAVAVRATAVAASYRRASSVVPVLRGVDLDVAPGEVVAVMGRSGSGKTTLLHVLGALAEPDAGSVTIAGVDIVGRRAAERAELRRRHLGFVFQAFHLLAGFTVAENVALPLTLDGRPARSTATAVHRILDLVGLDHRGDHRPGELSGGEAQRAAVARALVHEPTVVLADEPTGNLDDASASDVLDALVDGTRDRGAALVVVTHDANVAARADRCLTLVDGVLC